MTPGGEQAQVSQELRLQEGLIRNQSVMLGMGGLPEDDQLSKQLRYGGLHEHARPVGYLRMGDEEFGIVDLSNVQPDQDGLRRPFPPGTLHGAEDFAVQDAGEGLPTLILMHFEGESAAAHPIVPGRPMILGSREDIADYDTKAGNAPFTYMRTANGRTSISRYHGSLILDPETGSLQYTDHNSTNGTEVRYAEPPKLAVEAASVPAHESTRRQEALRGDSAKISAYGLAMQNRVRGLEQQQSLSQKETSFLTALASGASRDVAALLRDERAQLPGDAFDFRSPNNLWRAVGAAREILSADEQRYDRGGELIKEFDRRFATPKREPTGADVEWMVGHMSDAAMALHSLPDLRDRTERYAEDVSRLLADLAHHNRGVRISQYMHGNMQWVLQHYQMVWGDPSFSL